jgi:hypothetical protein
MSSRGRIVWVELLDPQGQNPKCRPAVIVTPTEDIRPDGTVWVVGITSRLDAAPTEVQVELPWDRRGHPRTGLRERCAAVCTWLARVAMSDVQSEAGNVPGPLLARILSLVGNLPAAPGSPPTPPEPTSPAE